MLRPVPRSIRSLRPPWPYSTSSSSFGLPSNGPLMRHRISRTFHSSNQFNQSLLSRLSRRVLYKKDGITLRSKRRGLVIAGWLSVTTLLLYTAISLLSDIEDIVLLLAAFIQLQQVDASSYSHSDPDTKQRDWDDWKESVLYFKNISKPVLVTLTWAEPDHVDRFFAELEDVVDQLDSIDRTHSQIQSEAGTLKIKIQNIMNTASHAVHRSLVSLQTQLSNPDSPLPSWPKSSPAGSSRLPSGTAGAETAIEGASEAVQHIREAIEAILHALQERVDREVSGEIDKELSGWFKVKGDGSGKGSKGKGYDIIG
ncbi:hypothetical protein J3R30DRAFT_3693347 [Lentinula aciculospora]|uniref:Uncharacterized protein n=1 Tax=Lentinula aciculospora TaxID=153920 RepID=A0A9W9AW09_9AGAR|nr:hypothetical protein J3R30DRAFT_3693347 [Lentinula aciculospora]